MANVDARRPLAKGLARLALAGAFTSATAILLLASLPGDARAQDGRTLGLAREASGEESLRVEVRYAAGTFTLRRGEPGLLYRVRLYYDEDDFDPVAEYADGRLRIGTEQRRSTIRRGGDGELDLELSSGVPTDLRLELGAARTDMDLGGIALNGLRVTTGAADSRLRVSAPNPLQMDQVRLEVGAARFDARELGNLNARRIRVDAGVGDVTLDLTGEWTGDLELSANLGLGSLEIRVPPEVGIQLSRNTVLVSMDAPDLTERGSHLVSANLDEARYRLDLSVDAAFGRLRVVRAN